MLLLAWGVVWALVAGAAAWTWLGGELRVADSRSSHLSATARALDNGHPLLTAQARPGEEPEHAIDDGLYPAGTSDDQGLFIVVPLISVVTGADPPGAMALLAVLLIAIPFVYYPLLFRSLFESTWAGIASPVLLLPVALVIPLADNNHWMGAWATIALLPILMLAMTRSGWATVLLTWGVALAAAAATEIRAQAGLAVLIAALLVLAFRIRGPIRLSAVIGVTLISYLFVFSIATDEIRASRDAILDTPEWSERHLKGHPTWHSAYIGLGYLPNDREIRWDDNVARRHAERRSPGVRYLSPEYEEVLRELTIDVVQEEPFRVVGHAVQKALVVVHRPVAGLAALPLVGRISIAGAAILPLLVLLALGSMPLWLSWDQRRLRLFLLILLPAVVLAFGPPVFGVPQWPHVVGLIAVTGLALILILCWAISAVHVRWRHEAGAYKSFADQFSAIFRSAVDRDKLPRATALVALALVAVIVLSQLGSGVEDRALRWADEGARDGQESEQVR